MLTMGIDIGSAACKSLILQDGEHILSKEVFPLGTGTSGPNKVFEQALASANLERKDIDHIMVTGYGRFTFEAADNQRSEITCHAAGMHFLAPDVRTLIDIGGQDIKILRMNERGKVENFVMNDKCAAGTGRFLDVMARVMNVRVEDLGELSMQSTEEVSISNTCTVFAESEVISKLSTGVKLPDLVAGIHASVAKRVASLAFRNGVEPEVGMSGGVALNKGIVKALSKELKINTNIRVPELCQYLGALGAAIYAGKEIK
ncbi:MAG: acyl-CoA dehydratase activase [Synergistaceae bacterium]|nr:acyl-CoA dehydratase activase [Synergistaceae bacterium]